MSNDAPHPHEPLVVVTTDHLRPGDAADTLLRSAGLRTLHAPLTGVRPPGELISRLESATAALVGNEHMTKGVFERLPELRVVVRTGVGYDSIDVEAASEHGVTVSNLPGVNAIAVAEYTIGLLLSGARRLATNAHLVRHGEWPRAEGQELRGSVLGVIGYGAAGREVVALATALGMRVLCATSTPPSPHSHDGEVRFVDLHTLLAESDYVTIHTALTAETEGLIDAAAIARMRPGTVLVNTARGPIVDEQALVEAVRSGHLRGAELDVVDTEPLPPESPLRGVPGINVYPHMAGQTAQARQDAGLRGAQEVIDSLAGRPRWALNADATVVART